MRSYPQVESIFPQAVESIVDIHSISTGICVQIVGKRPSRAAEDTEVSAMDHIELWDKAKALMREELANVSYTTWIEQPLKPVYVVDDKLALEVISDFNEKTIRARYLPMITEAVSQAAGREMTIELMSVKERIEWQERQKKEDAPAMQGINMFNPKSTFDTFVVGSSNRFAHAAALAVAEQPGMAYNPLFLYGGVGLGKTHLMHAIGHFIQDHFPNMRMLYLPSEMFTNELVAAIKNNKNVEFRNRFRNVDVLMLDDIQFIAGKVATQEEFFHTFNSLYDAGKQIILTSDRPPKDIQHLEERIQSRFEGGLIVDIQPPDTELRVAILKRKAQIMNVRLSDDVLNFLGENVKSNIRQLEGVIKKLGAYSFVNGSTITVDIARNVLSGVISGTVPPALVAEQIIENISKRYNISVEDIKGKKRTNEIALPRHIAIYVIRRVTNISLQNTAKIFGRDHTTILASVDVIKNKMAEDSSFEYEINSICNEFM